MQEIIIPGKDDGLDQTKQTPSQTVSYLLLSETCETGVLSILQLHLILGSTWLPTHSNLNEELHGGATLQNISN